MRSRTQLWRAVMALFFAVATSHAAAMTIPAGATIAVRMLDSIDSKTDHVGQTFRATLDSPLMVDGKIVVPRGAEAIGRLTAVEQAGRIAGRPQVAVELTALNFEGKSVAVRTSFYQEAGSSRGKQTAQTAGGGALLGAIIGAISGGKKGAAIGAGAGAAGGTVVQAVRGAERIRIPAESLLIFTLQSPIQVDTAS